MQRQIARDGEVRSASILYGRRPVEPIHQLGNVRCADRNAGVDAASSRASATLAQMSRIGCYPAAQPSSSPASSPVEAVEAQSNKKRARSMC